MLASNGTALLSEGCQCIPLDVVVWNLLCCVTHLGAIFSFQWARRSPIAKRGSMGLLGPIPFCRDVGKAICGAVPGCTNLVLVCRNRLFSVTFSHFLSI